MAENGLGGAFVPSADYTIEGDWTVNGDWTFNGSVIDTGTTLVSPTISGTVAGGASYTAPTLTAPVVTGGATVSGVVAETNTVTSATPSTTRYLHSAVTLTPASSIAVAAGGSIAGVRGEVTLTTAKTFTDGFLYGVQGKFTLNGTMNETSAARIVGVLGQVDLASGTVTDGQVSAVWADMQATSPTLTDPSQINVLRVTNSTSSTLNAMAFFYGQSSYLFTCGRDGGDPTYFGAAAPTSLAKSLKVKVGSTDYYIGLYSAAS